ncbi:hypothetical protein CK228_34110 [Mesorhizobium sp. WSM4312]|uniref:hypothetical protein n=1 Tax=Mesorhizobium sp. WSM4312 TaxID=2029411 RepID=UPI000BB0961E|nr:hypothetical protein [Mesorhizobium sp. WSM4312]PBB64242.1 hypothetical protein CK228_34110 [Mesorhizobium sp. WSM4312]
MTNETPEAKADRIRESLKLPAKPNTLRLAESDVERARTRRAELRAEIQDAGNAGGVANRAHLQQLTVELEAFERGDSRKSFEERTRRREEFSKCAMAETAAAVAEYRTEMNRLVDEMEALNAAAVELLARFKRERTRNALDRARSAAASRCASDGSPHSRCMSTRGTRLCITMPACPNRLPTLSRRGI